MDVTQETRGRGELTCPRCHHAMESVRVGEVEVIRCASCAGIFLDRAEVGLLSEAENDWHRGATAHTEPVPRVTSGMSAPPPARPRARSFLETLFG